MSERCPKCGAAADCIDCRPGNTVFACHTEVRRDGKVVVRSDRCKIRELEQALANSLTLEQVCEALNKRIPNILYDGDCECLADDFGVWFDTQTQKFVKPESDTTP